MTYAPQSIHAAAQSIFDICMFDLITKGLDGHSMMKNSDLEWMIIAAHDILLQTPEHDREHCQECQKEIGAKNLPPEEETAP